LNEIFLNLTRSTEKSSLKVYTQN